jgi:nuclear pore complex protein Nup205
MDSESGSLEQANRLAALGLLIQDTELLVNRPFPNIAHFRPFGGKVGDQTIQDLHALGARQTSIHILLELVNAGIPRLRGKRKEKGEMGPPVDPLFFTLPGLSERCYRVLYQLCIHPRTSDFTTCYLRTREDFFARQIAKVPAHVPQTPHNATIQVLYSDSSRVTTNVVSLSSFLRLRSYIFDLVALELHVLTNKGHFKGVSELLDILFGNDFEYEEDEFTAFHEVGQSPMRVIDLFQSLMFDWADSLSVEPISLQYLDSLNLQSCIRRDATGCEIVDRTSLLNLLSAAKRTVHAQGGVATSAQNDRLSSEISYILKVVLSRTIDGKFLMPEWEDSKLGDDYWTLL